jgi:plasmid stabilization system protein ParE
MDERLVWTLGADADLQEIYETLGEPQANEFLLRLDAALTLLRIFPEQGPVYSANHRRLLVGRQRFHGLYYSIEGRRIVISAIVDLRQDPEKIAQILKERTGREQDGAHQPATRPDSQAE